MKDNYFRKNRKSMIVVLSSLIIIFTMAITSFLFFKTTKFVSHLFNESVPLYVNIYSNYHSFADDIQLESSTYTTISYKYQQFLDSLKSNPDFDSVQYDYFIYNNEIYFGKNLNDSTNYVAYIFDGFSLTKKEEYLQGMSKDYASNHQYDYVYNYYQRSNSKKMIPISMFNPLIIGMKDFTSSTMIKNNIEIIEGRNIEANNEIIIPNNMMIITKDGSNLVSCNDIIPLTIETKTGTLQINFTVVGKHNGDGVLRMDINSLYDGINLSDLIFISKDAYTEIQNITINNSSILSVRKNGGIITPIILINNNDHLIASYQSIITEVSKLSSIDNAIYFNLFSNIDENIPYLTSLNQFEIFSLFIFILCLIALPFTLFLVLWISLHQRIKEFSILLSLGFKIRQLIKFVTKSYIHLAFIGLFISISVTQFIYWILVKITHAYFPILNFDYQSIFVNAMISTFILSIGIICLMINFIQIIIKTIFNTLQLKTILNR